MKKVLYFIRRSLSARLSLWLVLFAVIIFIASLSFIFKVSRETVRQEAITHATQTLDNTVLRVNAILDRVEVVSNNIAWLALSHLDTPDSMFFYTRSLVENNPNVNGCSLAFEPYFFNKKGRYFSAYSYYTDNDVIKTVQEGNEQYDYYSMDWYLLPKLLDCPCWTEPFIDLSVDSTFTKEMLISFCKPMKDTTGKFVGVIATDISLAKLSQTISAMKPYPHSYCIATGRGGTFFVHPDSTKLFYETIFTETLKYPNAELTSLGHAMQEGKDGMRQLTIDGKDNYVFFKPLGMTGWSVAIVCPESDIFGGYNRLKRAVATIVIIGLLLILYFFSRIVNKELTPLQQLAQNADTIASGQFDTELPDTHRIDEIGVLSQSFTHMQQSLVNYIEELKTTTAQKAMIDSELNVAKGIQMSMLPKVFPPYPERQDIDIFAHLTSAKEVGGDLFDFYIRDEKLFFCLGDVSGKGVPAALLMTMTKSQFRTISRHTDQPHEIVMEMNDIIADGNTAHMFVTLFLGCLDLSTGRLLYCNGAHNPPLLIGSEIATLPVISHFPVGVIMGTKYVTQEIQLQSQTTLFIYTDGLTEAETRDHTQFGIERLNEIIHTVQQSNEDPLPTPLITRITEAVHAFVGDAPQSDDLTMMAIQYLR